MRYSQLSVVLVLIFLALTGFPTEASGPVEGGRRVRLDDEPVGPYLLRVATSPNPPTVDNLYVEVRVKEAVSGRILTDAQVTVQAEPEGETGEVLLEIATHDFAPIPTEYAAHLRVPATGLWKITVRIDSELGPAEVSFLERVSNPLAVGTLIAVGAPLAGLAALVLIFLWLQRNAKRDTLNGTPA